MITLYILHLIYLEYDTKLFNQSRIFSSGSFALSSVNLYLFSDTLASNCFLNSGRVNSRPITHSEADTLYFLALFNKMISSCSGLMIRSTKLKILTKIIFSIYLLRGRKSHSMPTCFHKSCTWAEFMATERYHYLTHWEHTQHFCLLSRFSLAPTQRWQELLLAPQ